MKGKIIRICIIGLLIGTSISLVNSVSACTGFTASKEGNVLVGSNFDWSMDFNVYMNVYPEGEGKYGRIIFDIWWPWFGFDHTLPIQGMNDQGLFVDTYMTPEHPVDYSGKPLFFDDEDPEYYNNSLYAYCLAKCSTISEVLDVYLNQYDQWWPDGISQGQIMFADANGDSIIIEDYDTMIYREGDFQVVTNFLQSDPGLGGYPCWRYDKAVSMLENMTDLSVDYFTSICDATHVDNSVFSNVYDLKQEKIWTYHFYDYDNVLEIDLNEELSNGYSRTYLGSLFEPEGNQPPNKPNKPLGNKTGIPDIEYKYKCKRTTDPDGNKITYLFDWGDTTDSGWLPKQFTTYMVASHKWDKPGNYQVKVKAMDIYGRESECSDPLDVIIPRTKAINRPFFNFLENHPLLYRFLQLFFQRLGL